MSNLGDRLRYARYPKGYPFLVHECGSRPWPLLTKCLPYLTPDESNDNEEGGEFRLNMDNARLICGGRVILGTCRGCWSEVRFGILPKGTRNDDMFAAAAEWKPGEMSPMQTIANLTWYTLHNDAPTDGTPPDLGALGLTLSPGIRIPTDDERLRSYRRHHRAAARVNPLRRTIEGVRPRIFTEADQK